MLTIDQRLGRAVARLRQEAGMSQYELARCLGVNQATISKWESGAPMSAATAWTIAEAMRVPPWLLFATAEVDQEMEMPPGVVATVRALLARPVGDTIP